MATNPTTVSQFLFAALLLTAIIAGTFSMISVSIPDNAGTFADYNRTFQKFEQIESNTKTVSDTMEDAKPQTGIDGILTGLWDISFGAISSVWTSITTVTTFIGDLNGQLGIPSWFTGLLISIILVSVTFAIIASIRKWNI